MFRLGLIDHATALDAAKAAADRALEVDPEVVEAHTSLATIAGWLEWDWAAAEAGFQRALKLGENARTARFYGVLLTILERHADAERMFRRARSIEPFSIQQEIAEALSHYQARRYGLLITSPPDTAYRPGSVEAAVYRMLARVFSYTSDGANVFFAELSRTLPSCAKSAAAIIPA